MATRSDARITTADRLLWPDFVRTVAIFGVIVVHVAGVPASQFGTSPHSSWWWAHGYDSFVRPCIPLFVMLSGGLLLTRADWDIAYFVQRRLGRVVIPFVAWSLLYALWALIFAGEVTTAGSLLRRFASGMADPPYPHLWYLPLIIGLYVLVPILRVYVLNASLINQVYFAGLWIVVTGVVPELEAWLRGPITFPLTLVYGWVGYFVLGATMSIYLPLRLQPVWIVVASTAVVAGFAGTFWGTYVLTARGSGQLSEHFYSQLSITVIVMSIGAFVLLRACGLWIDRVARKASAIRVAITAIGATSFGVYLLHRAFIELLPSGTLGFSFGPQTFHPALAIPACSIAVFLVSFAIVWTMRRRGALRWLVP